jgi:integrase
MNTPMDIKLPGLVEEQDCRGKWHLYVRRGKTKLGPQRKIRLREVPKTEAFIKEYQKAYALLFRNAAAPEPEAKPVRLGDFPLQTFGWLVNRYYLECIAFRTMAPAGAGRRRKILDALAIAHGSKGMMIPTPIIAAGFAARLEKVEAANYWLKSVKALYSWSTEMGITRDNPAAKVRKVRRKTEGFHIWSLDELRAYVARHPLGTRAHLALMLLLFTGFRRSDAHLLGRQHIRDGKIRFQTGKEDAIFTAVAAQPFLASAAAAPKHEHMAFLVNGWDRPFASGNAFGNWFKDRCREAGLDHCSAHGVRKAAASIASENGATAAQLDAMFTWTDGDQRATYTRGASQLKLASAGFTILENALAEAGIIGQSGNDLAQHEPGVEGCWAILPSKSLKRKG